MNRKLLILTVFLFIVACSTKKKDNQQNKTGTTFIDSTDFKYFGLENFDIQEWFDGKLKLKSLNKEQAKGMSRLTLIITNSIKFKKMTIN